MDQKCCCIKMYENEKTEELTMMKESRTFFISFVIMVFIFYWMYCTLELTYANYLTTYVVDELNWSKTAAALPYFCFLGNIYSGKNYWDIYC